MLLAVCAETYMEPMVTLAPISLPHVLEHRLRNIVPSSDIAC
jgi:hypothetical protein